LAQAGTALCKKQPFISTFLAALFRRVSMATTGVKSIFLVLVILPHASFAATLGSERKSVVRSETNRQPATSELSGIQLNSHGDAEVIDHLKRLQGVVEAQITDSNKLSPKDETKTDPYCDMDYPTGVVTTSDCTNPTALEVNIDSNGGADAMCLQAATESGAKALSGKFVLRDENFQKIRPKGCFKQACHESDNGVCYFYNPVNGVPDKTLAGFAGTPICKRPKTHNGTKGVAGSCPTGYQMIDDEETCRSAANCRGWPQANIFRVGTHNASKHLDWVRGCFFDEDDGNKVYYNRPINPAMGECTNCKGRQICLVTSTTSWVGATELTADSVVPAIPHRPNETETEREADTERATAAAVATVTAAPATAEAETATLAP